MANKLTDSLEVPLVHPDVEQMIISKVADQYGLQGDQRNLLFAIRKAENGKQGKEFGVLNKQAMRFKNDPDPTKSLAIQAMWAAGSIKNHYKGDLNEFAKRWAPVGVSNDPTNLNKNWVKNVSYFMGDQDGQDS